MNQPFTQSELTDLLYDLAENRLSEVKRARLEALLLADPDKQQRYLEYLLMISTLHRTGSERTNDYPGRSASNYFPPSDQADELAPILLDISSQATTSQVGLGNLLFSYGVSAFLVAIALVVAGTWTWHRRDTVANRPTPTTGRSSTDLATPCVGRVSGTVACLSANPSSPPREGQRVRLGDEYALVSGLMEITYDRGAKVLLQGPCTYRVDSAASGYLASGRITARVTKKHATSAASEDVQYPDPDASPPTALSLFAVRTPNALVTDLGTEFAVEVDTMGASRAFVFSGKIDLRPVDRNRNEGKSVILTENQTARVLAGRSAEVTRDQVAGVDKTFVRRLPPRVKIPLFNTGVGLSPGSADDPHWQIVARSDQPGLKPASAVVVKVMPQYRRENDPASSQWISPLTETLRMPDEVTVTFRTTFDLLGVVPETAVLRGKFLVDDGLQEIRLNGRALQQPKHYRGEKKFFDFHPFVIASGFVEGRNVLEFDVRNGGYSGSSPKTTSYLLLRVELEGYAIADWEAFSGRETSPPSTTVRGDR